MADSCGSVSMQAIKLDKDVHEYDQECDEWLQKRRGEGYHDMHPCKANVR